MHGVHYTPQALALHVAYEIAKVYDFRGSSVEILDPAVGGGELLSAMVSLCSGRMQIVKALGYDIDSSAVGLAKARLRQEFPSLCLALENADFLDAVDGPSEGNLFSAPNRGIDPVDIVIANPPYVRTQNLGAERVRELAKKFHLDGRVDVYQAFLRGISAVLRPGGIAGVIVSNRFMSVKSGEATRSSIIRDFDILHVWDLGDTRIFEAAVLPAVLILRKKFHTASEVTRARFTAAYRVEGTPLGLLPGAKDTCDALTLDGLVRVDDGQVLSIRHGFLDLASASGTWCISTALSDGWLKRVASKTERTFGDVGKIRVGVKTTADSIFLPRTWDNLGSEKPELLRPLTTHHVARRFRSLVVERQILYPHVVENGIRKAANLNDYPASKSYLETHREALEGRKYVIEGGRQWYEIWVPQDPDAWTKPKIVFRDIAEQPTFWMDLDGTVVNGDCYWISAEENDIESLWLILAVANSKFIEDFYDHTFNNKLYAGRRRFMTQYVEQFPLPALDSPRSARMIELAKRMHSETSSGLTSAYVTELETLVAESFGVDANLLGEQKNSWEGGSVSSYSQSCLQIA